MSLALRLPRSIARTTLPLLALAVGPALINAQNQSPAPSLSIPFEQYTLPNYHTISEDRLLGLDGTRLERLNKAGMLRAAYYILASLGNVSRLIELKNRKRATR